MARRSPLEKLGDRLFTHLLQSAVLALALLLGAIALMVLRYAWPAIQSYGLSFLMGREWNPVAGREQFGALPLIWGTLASSAIALTLAAPLGIGTAIFLSEDLLPVPLRRGLSILVDLLAAIPSIVYGLWGLRVLVPLLLPLEQQLHTQLGWIPFFSTLPLGPGLLPAALVLAVMIVPMIAAIAQDSLLALPLDLRLGAMAVGATRWEAIACILVPAAGSGLVGGILLALGRALGETMAVTLLIGNVNQISPSLFAPANTIASLLANQFAAARGLHIAALMYAALVLLGLTLLVNLLAELILRRLKRQFPS